jgi:hypothetical protein
MGISVNTAAKKSRGAFKMESTNKRIIRSLKWISPAAGIVIIIFFAFYYLSSNDSDAVKEAPVKGRIAAGWARMAGNRAGKAIFAQPPRMIILDLKTGVTKIVPNVVTAGAPGRKPRGESPRPFWSPDGKRFIYRYNGGVFVCDESGNKKEIKNKLMDCAVETRWSWRAAGGEDWAVGPAKNGNVIMVKISDPTVVKTVYGGGDVCQHCEMTGSGRYIVYAVYGKFPFSRRSDVYVARVGSKSRDESKKISRGQACRPCADPGERVAWLPSGHKEYLIHNAATGKQIGVLHAPPEEEIYRLNWSNDADFATHMYGSEGNERIHVRRISTGEYLFVGSGWDPDLWVD